MGLKREIGLVGAAFIALNGIVGGGIFALPQTLVEGVGPFSAYLFPLFGLMMISVALVFADLARLFDTAGGPVVYATAAFGKFAGFQAGWLYYLARIAAGAANINALLTYLAAFAPGIDQGMARAVTIIAVFAGLVGLNIVGVKQTVRTLNVVTVVKLAPLLLLAMWGLAANVSHIPLPTAAPSLGQVGGVSLLLLYAFVGFEIASITAGETRDAKSNVPRALIATLAAMAGVYFVIQLAYVAIMQGAAPEGAPLASAAGRLAGPAGVIAITIAAAVSIGGNLLASMLTTPRVTFALAEAGALPAWFGAVDKRFSTPAHSILALGLIAGALALTGAFVWLAAMSALARLAVYLLCTGALVRLRAAPIRWTAWIAPAASVVLCVWAAAQAKAEAWVFLTGFALAGAALYALARWRRPA